ncbi:hypothetical protein SDC9_154830 [bioreactor metagenome]|uniref:Uncharacterized protein n=1 Tax=bioreactor metagenome TaxID=1076179 RepID=A0A645F2A0_9ZZZZ
MLRSLAIGPRRLLAVWSFLYQRTVTKSRPQDDRGHRAYRQLTPDEVQQAVEFLGRAHLRQTQVAGITSHRVAGGDLRKAGQIARGAVGHCRRQRLDFDEGRQWTPDLRGVHVRSVAGDDPPLFQPAHTLLRSRRRQPDLAPQLGERHAPITRQQGKYLLVCLLHAVMVAP